MFLVLVPPYERAFPAYLRDAARRIIHERRSSPRLNIFSTPRLRTPINESANWFARTGEVVVRAFKTPAVALSDPLFASHAANESPPGTKQQTPPAADPADGA